MTDPRNLPSALDQRRLRDGELALCMQTPKTVEETRQQIGAFGDAIAGLQSLDDLGVDANAYASKLHDALFRRLRTLERVLAHLLKETPSGGGHLP